MSLDMDELAFGDDSVGIIFLWNHFDGIEVYAARPECPTLKYREAARLCLWLLAKPAIREEFMKYKRLPTGDIIKGD